MNRKWLLYALIASLLLVIGLPISAQDDNYQIPEPPDDVDLNQVIGQVDDMEITLGEFRQRVRFERLQTYNFLQSLAADRGEEVLNINDPENQVAQGIISVLRSMVDDRTLGESVYNTLLLDYLYHQEAEERGIEVTECDIDVVWTSLLNYPPVIDCEQLPEGFEEAREEYIALAETYTGLSPQELNQILAYQAEFRAVSEAIGAELEVEDETVIRTRHIRVEDEETANTVFERLEAGDSFEELLAEFTIDSAVGNRGDLGEFSRGMMVPEFEEAAFNAEVGEIVGPVQSQFGFHIIEVTDQRLAESAQIRQMLLENAEDAEAAVRLINDGRDIQELAREYSINPIIASGDLMNVEAGGAVMGGEAVAEAIFSTEPGEVIGPISGDQGYFVILVEDIGESAVALTARHILLETEEAAQTALERLEDGEDFGDLAEELSIDPSAQGLGDDTLTIATGGQSEGFYGVGEIIPEFDVVFDAEVGDFVGPVATQFGYFIFEVQEFSTRPAADAQMQQSQYVSEWQAEQLESDRVMTTELWRGNVPTDPLPSDVSPMLAVLDEPLEEQREQYLAAYEANLIPNLLRTLRITDTTLPPGLPPGLSNSDGPPIEGPPLPPPVGDGATDGPPIGDEVEATPEVSG